MSLSFSSQKSYQKYLIQEIEALVTVGKLKDVSSSVAQQQTGSWSRGRLACNTPIGMKKD